MQRGSTIKLTAGLGVLLIAGGIYVWKFVIHKSPSPAPIAHVEPLPSAPIESTAGREFIVEFAGCTLDPEIFGEIAHATESLSETLKKYGIPTTLAKTEGKCEIQFVNGPNKMSITRFGTDQDMFQQAVSFFQLNPETAVEP